MTHSSTTRRPADLGRTDNLWVGVTPHAPLKVLHNKVDQALARVGIGPDKRTFLPHVTIARFGREFGSMEGFVSRSGGVRSQPSIGRASCRERVCQSV